jgi:hypothetical protein
MASAKDDYADPFFLHPSDHPGLQVVSHQFNGDNFSSWHKSMIVALSGKNKLGFLDGTIKKPEITATDKLLSWKRNNNIIASWIVNSLSKEIAATVLYSNSAAEIWNNLLHRFQQKNGLHIFELKKQLLELRQGSVSAHFTHLKALWDELSDHTPQHQCTCDGVKPLLEHFHQEYVLHFLMGLNDNFSAIRGEILCMDPLPTIQQVFSLVLQDERHRDVGNSFPTEPSQIAFFL